MFRSKVAIASAVVLFSLTVQSPGQAESNFLGGLYFNAGSPQGEWDDQIKDDALGVNGQIFYAPSNSPFAVGLDVSWSNYGSVSREEPFNPNIPEVTLDVTTNNNLVQSFFVLRGQIGSGPIQPYADALVGIHYLYTETRVSDEDNDGFDAIASSTNQDDAASAYGFGGGVMIPLWRQDGDCSGPQSFLIDIGGRYIRGGKAEYLKEGSLLSEDGRVQIETVESETDLAKLHVGVAVRF